MGKRKGLEIRAEMLRKGITMKTLAKEIGVTHALVSRTISGHINNRRVLRALLDLGVPSRFLDLPTAMRTEEAA